MPRLAKEATCQGCGVIFMAKKGTRQKGHYCTRECAFKHIDQWQRKQPKAEKVRKQTACIECGTMLDGGRKRYCGDGCRKASANRKALEYGQRKHEEMEKRCVCRVCKGRFMPEYGTKRRVLCSDICEATAKRAAKHGSGKGNHRKRARIYGVEYEPVSRAKVYARDRWRCGICGEKINRRLTYPHLLSPSLDHVVPMARGGGHTYANTQAAHFICNSLKGDGSAGEQLALIG